MIKHGLVTVDLVVRLKTCGQCESFGILDIHGLILPVFILWKAGYLCWISDLGVGAETHSLCMSDRRTVSLFLVVRDGNPVALPCLICTNWSRARVFFLEKRGMAWIAILHNELSPKNQKLCWPTLLFFFFFFKFSLNSFSAHTFFLQETSENTTLHTSSQSFGKCFIWKCFHFVCFKEVMSSVS